MEVHNDDFKKFMYAVIIGFLLLLVVWLSILFLSSCAFDLNCQRTAALEISVRTPIPTLLPATLPAQPAHGQAGAFDRCSVHALDLIGAWASAQSPDEDAFAFMDLNGDPCEATYKADIQPLFSESNVWFPASLSCTSCHNSAFKEGTGGLDLTSYAGLMAGSGRATPEVARGRNILGGGDWQSSILFAMLTRVENIPSGHPTFVYSPLNLIVYAGRPVPIVEAITTP